MLKPVDSDAAKVDPIVPEEQGIPKEKFSPWMWSVTPLRDGQIVLKLLCYTIIETSRGLGPPEYVLERETKILVNPATWSETVLNHKATFIEEVIKGVTGWILAGAMLLGGLIWAGFKKWHKRPPPPPPAWEYV